MRGPGLTEHINTALAFESCLLYTIGQTQHARLCKYVPITHQTFQTPAPPVFILAGPLLVPQLARWLPKGRDARA